MFCKNILDEIRNAQKEYEEYYESNVLQTECIIEEYRQYLKEIKVPESIIRSLNEKPVFIGTKETLEVYFRDFLFKVFSNGEIIEYTGIFQTAYNQAEEETETEYEVDGWDSIREQHCTTTHQYSEDTYNLLLEENFLKALKEDVVKFSEIKSFLSSVGRLYEYQDKGTTKYVFQHECMYVDMTC